MGDMADFYNECYMEDFYGEYDSDPDWSIPPNPKYTRKEIYCGHCNKKGLNWKPWKDSWVLFEKSGVVYSCARYSIPIDLLKKNRK